MKPANEDSISLNKFISSSGICSRREADRWIENGKVTINGKVAKKGNRVKKILIVMLFHCQAGRFLTNNLMILKKMFYLLG